MRSAGVRSGSVPGSDLVVIEKAAHMGFIEQPKAYLDAIRLWLTGQGVIGQEQV